MQHIAGDWASRSWLRVRAAGSAVTGWTRGLGVHDRVLDGTRRLQTAFHQAIGDIDGSNGQNNGEDMGDERMHARYQHPSILAFFTSRYSIALMILSLITNRIHAVVNVNIPYRSSAKVRAICRAPAIILLVRACLLVTSMMLKLDVAGPSSSRYFYSIKNALDTPNTHAEVLWSCFVACCVACANESFVRALDNDLASITPVNLFSLGLLLHNHSTPYHDPVSPPTAAVYLLILLQLGEILALQIAAIPVWRVRLWITGSFTIASRAAMIYFWVTSSDNSHSALMPAIHSFGRIVPETFFVACSLLTVSLRALVQLITEGRISKEIFGHSSSLPHRDDDFLLAIIKYGAATLETTAMKGLNNEVSALAFPSATYVELYQSSNTFGQIAGSSTSGQVLQRHPAYPSMPRVASPSNPFENEVRDIKAMPSIPNDADSMSRNPSLRKEIYRFCKAVWVLWKLYVTGWSARKLGLTKLADGTGRLAKGLRFIGVEPQDKQDDAARRGAALAALKEFLRTKRTAQRPTAVDAFSALERDDDDDDPDFEADDQSSTGGDSIEDSSSEEEDEDVLDSPPSPSARSREATPMPGRLEELDSLLNEELDDGDDLTPVLLAHLQTKPGVQSPLTRRKYKALLAPSSGVGSPRMDRSSPAESALTTAIAVRRSSGVDAGKPTADRWDEDSFRGASTCVVCCSEPRCVVLWPCRCLALCNDCRSELAARSIGQGGSSLCPCCRADVQGYSRIMIP